MSSVIIFTIEYNIQTVVLRTCRPHFDNTDNAQSDVNETFKTVSDVEQCGKLVSTNNQGGREGDAGTGRERTRRNQGTNQRRGRHGHSGHHRRASRYVMCCATAYVGPKACSCVFLQGRPTPVVSSRFGWFWARIFHRHRRRRISWRRYFIQTLPPVGRFAWIRLRRTGSLISELNIYYLWVHASSLCQLECLHIERNDFARNYNAKECVGMFNILDYKMPTYCA